MTTNTSVASGEAMTDIVNELDLSAPDPSIAGMLITLVENRRTIAIGSVLTAATVGALAFVIPPSYQAQALILPPQQQQSTAAALTAGALAGLAGGSSMAAQLGLKSPSDLYIGMLKSRTIADDIIKQFNLRQVYHQALTSDARKVLMKRATFSSGKDSLIAISVVDKDPARAAEVANAYVDELFRQNSRLALTEASQRRLFFEQQIARERDELTAAEAEFKKSEQKTGLMVPGGQAQVLISSGAQLRATIASREVELQAMRAYATEENPRIQVLHKEIAALQSQMAQLENSQGRNTTEISAGKLPDASLEYARRLRDVKYHEMLFEFLSKQYEASRIDEAKQSPVIQVVDRAVTPDKSTRPSWPILILAAWLCGLIVSSLAVLGSQAVARLKSGWGVIRAAAAA